MDKFGIFNLLNSLFGFYGDKNASPSAGENSSPPAKPDKTPDKKSDAPADVPLPLQASMLDTMRNHDEFVRRVMQNDAKRKN